MRDSFEAMEPRGPIAGPASSTLSAFRRAWHNRRPYQTFSWITGAALMLSGLIHLGVFAIDGGSWQGPVSWRKPVTFGLSFGLTTVTLAWLAGMLRYRRILAIATATVAVTSALEVFLVTMQKWRGVPSHFNEETVFDTVVFFTMGITVSILGLAIVTITVFAFKSFDADPAMIVGVRVGLLVLIASQILGGAIIANGEILDREPLETDLAIFGEAGLMKLPHAVTMHAIQVLPILGLMLVSTSLPPGRRRNIMWFASAGYIGLILATLLQTFEGRAPSDLTPLAVGVVLASVLLGGVAIFGLTSGLFGSKPGDPSA
ncbi:hypothetical protein BH23ACT12_BH23ACT12_19120 [soil metagenome]